VPLYHGLLMTSKISIIHEALDYIKSLNRDGSFTTQPDFVVSGVESDGGTLDGLDW
jgi:hypothetical protein